jgi:hypothetical protein
MPTPSFFLEMSARECLTGEAADCVMMGVGFLENNNAFASHDNEQFVAGLHPQGFAGFARDDNLVFGRYGYVRHALHCIKK